MTRLMFVPNLRAGLSLSEERNARIEALLKQAFGIQIACGEV